MPKRFTEEFKTQIVDLYKTGLSMPQVASKLGISQSSVSRIVRQSGYDRFHVGGRIAKSIPNVPAAKPVAKPSTGFTVTSRTMKLQSNVTGCVYEISTDSDIIHIESENALMDIKVSLIDALITELQGIKKMLAIPS